MKTLDASANASASAGRAPALDAKGNEPTLYPPNSHRCAACGEILPRVWRTEYRQSLKREASWSTLDFDRSVFYRGSQYHPACHPTKSEAAKRRGEAPAEPQPDPTVTPTLPTGAPPQGKGR